ncbi:MAG: tRNA 4-thiouridine(8) synthase ThiI [Clostridiales Family XIII bacterium]|jgi:thiamine biosynthesis protein ThiI|nr:tRNA 4-thiouridine(8) synthase ThiI [Clostridiales Family XIII bacterium]
MSDLIVNEAIKIRRILIVRYGEVALKGMNKPYFERILRDRIRNALKKLDSEHKTIVETDAGLIVVRGEGEILPADEKAMIAQITRVFGVATVSPAICLYDREIAAISDAATGYLRDRLNEWRAALPKALAEVPAEKQPPMTFKIAGKRSDKTYPLESMNIAAQVGSDILDVLGPAVKVDVHDPDVILTVHLRQREVFLFDEKVAGFGGLPLGTNGKGMVLLSGGIDSPVAAWLMAKRGMTIEAVHFHSYPYTSGRAREKVEELAGILAGYCGSFDMHVINLLPAQEQIAAHCAEELMTILVRRFMVVVAERVANLTKCDMMITGENLGQVASQTAEALVCTDAAAKMPVMRPLIALDKTDIIEKAKEIGTFEKSIEPYEDCCTVFLPKHPATRPHIDQILEAEANIPDLEALIESLVASRETVRIRPL